MKLRSLFTLFIVVSFFCSCTPKVQLVTLKSSNPALQENNFVYEDSLIKVSYDFYSPNGVVKFKVYNKFKTPIFIDWKNSSLIVASDKRFEYWNNESRIQGDTYGSNVDLLPWLSVNSGQLNGSITSEERITFLPPQTEIEVRKFRLSQTKGYDIKKSNQQVLEASTWKKSKAPAKVLESKFTTENTPLNFRNYITIATSEDFKNPLYYDFGFWISEVREMGGRQFAGSFYYDLTPNEIVKHPYKRSDRFFIEK